MNREYYRVYEEMKNLYPKAGLCLFVLSDEEEYVLKKGDYTKRFFTDSFDVQSFDKHDVIRDFSYIIEMETRLNGEEERIMTTIIFKNKKDIDKQKIVEKFELFSA